MENAGLKSVKRVTLCEPRQGGFTAYTSTRPLLKLLQGLRMLFPPKNGQKWLTCAAVTSQAEDMAYIPKNLT